MSRLRLRRHTRARIVQSLTGDNALRLWANPSTEVSVERRMTRVIFDSLANSPTIQTEWTRDSCASIFGNGLASIIVSRLRVYYTRSCSLCPIAWALSYRERCFSFPCLFQRDCTRSIFRFFPEIRAEYRTRRTLCSTFVREPVHQSDEWAKKLDLFFLPIQR